MAAAAAAVGMKRGSYERDKEAIFEKRCKCNYWEEDDDVFEMPVVGAKRGYERDEFKSDVIFTKRYKCNYWEDPAKARELERGGGRLAEMAALDNDNEQHFAPEMHAWIVAYAASAGHK